MFSWPVVWIIFDLGRFINGDGIAFHYPFNYGFAINDIFVCFEWNVLNGNMVIIDNACFISNELSIFVTNFGKLYFINGKVLVVFVCPVVLPNVHIAIYSDTTSTMGNHWHCSEKQIISILSNSLLVYVLFVI